MKNLSKILLAAAIPLAALTACGGGDDLQDRLDVADPAVRFVDASAVSPNVTLFKSSTAQADATNVSYKFASNYFDIGTDSAPWSVQTTVGGVTLGSPITIDPQRGTKYTIVALDDSSTVSSTYLIVDPYNKPLGSSSTHLRIMNASFNAANIDLYMNSLGTDITAAGVTPLISGTAYKTSGPASGSDSVDIAASTYQVTVTTAGTKTILFKGQINFGTNQDILLLTVPDSTKSGGINVLQKVEGTAGANDVPTI
jgi:hypothetical protein